jgi:cation transport ATPase
LKENEQLVKSNRDLQAKEQRARTEASAMISAVKQEYSSKQAELQKSIDDAKAREFAAQCQINEESDRINELAEAKVSQTRQSLKKQYKDADEKQKRNNEKVLHKLKKEYNGMKDRLAALTYGGILYGFFATILTGINSTRFSEDIIAVLAFIIEFISFLWGHASFAASEAWKLRNKIPYTIIDTIIPGLLAIVLFIVIFVGVLTLVCYCIYKVGEFYSQEFADSASVAVALISLAVLVWFADKLTFISWNLVVIFLIIHAVYLFIRMLTIPSKSRY